MADARDWPEDFEHENGMYYCMCCECGQQFVGYKRRVVCKLCAEQSAKAAETVPDRRPAMDKVNKQELRRLAEEAKNGELVGPYMLAMPDDVLSLLDELEQCRKDAERWRFAYQRDIDLGVTSESGVDELIAMTKDGGANA